MEKQHNPDRSFRKRPHSVRENARSIRSSQRSVFASSGRWHLLYSSARTTDAYKNADPGPLEARIASIQLDVLIHAAAQFVRRWAPLADLNPVEVQRLGFLPPLISGVSIYIPVHQFKTAWFSHPWQTAVFVGVIGTHGVLSDLLVAIGPMRSKLSFRRYWRLRTGPRVRDGYCCWNTIQTVWLRQSRECASDEILKICKMIE